MAFKKSGPAKGPAKKAAPAKAAAPAAEKEYDNEMRISLFPNSKKKFERDPVMFAKFQIEGMEHFGGVHKSIAKSGMVYWKCEERDFKLILFKNETKEQENQPDMRGTITLDNGATYRVSLWNGESASGVKYASGQVQVPRELEEGEQSQAENVNVGASEDDLPF